MANIHGGTTKSIAAQNTFTDACKFDSLPGRLGHFAISTGAAWVATVYFQISFDDGATWLDVDSFTSDTVEVFEIPERDVRYRAGIITGGYTSGTVILRISG